jgi:molybdopterin-containing oxidoreductase family membrane subunit
MVATAFAIPFALMARGATRTPLGTLIASASVIVGMWLERFNIVVPTSVTPRWELAGLGGYLPSWIELSIMAGTFAGFIALYMIAAKFVPIVSIWEIKEGRERSVKDVSDRVAGYLPEAAELDPAGVR